MPWPKERFLDVGSRGMVIRQYGSLVSIVLIPDRKPVDLGVADVADVAAIAVYVAVRVAS